MDVTETELALELLEKAIYQSLRRSDVSTRYSSKQLIVILMDANKENGDMVANRILKCFYELYTDGKVQVDYGIACMDGSEEEIVFDLTSLYTKFVVDYRRRTVYNKK